MAKIRVHELARELNMTNKVLLDKLQAMDLPTPVRSHMSSLDDDVVAFVKASVARPKGKPVDEKRIGSTVIRRRKKEAPRLAPAGADIEPSDAEEPDEAEFEAPEEAVSQEAPEVVAEEAASQEKAAPEPSLPAEPQAKEDSGKKTDRPPVRKRTAEDKARIISKPEPEPSPEAPPPPALEQEDAAVQAAPETPVPEAVELAPETVESAPEAAAGLQAPEAPAAEAAPVSGEAASEEAAAGEAAPSPAPGQEASEEAAAGEEDAEGKKTAKAKKKKKKETAAKIISLPERPVEPTIPPSYKPKPPPAPPAATPAVPAAGETETEEQKAARKDKRKKKGKRETEEETDPRLLKKKSSFKKKAVVEGADLYDRAPGRLRKGKKGQKAQYIPPKKTLTTVPKAIKRRIKIDDAVALSDLAKRLGVKAAELIKSLMNMGTMATLNQMIDYETAVVLASEFEYEVERASFEEDTVLKAAEDAPETLLTRPPVVTIMGHVDHGKTSLLDAIRQTHVTDGEAGGITQHIGAYMVDVPKGQIAFLDTPGHEAFTAMRARGAKVTDIVVLVVAADDGVMPQTVEAVNHSKAAGVPIIVAVNKMDKDGADPERVMRELADHALIPEAWGGDTIFVEVSAKKKVGIDSLLEMILLQAEVLELQANPDKLARGHVVEAKVDPGRGPVATVLIQEGTLHAGDAVVCGIHYGKIRAMYDDLRRPMDIAGPSMPAEILGLSGVPMAGDEVIAVTDEKVAKQVSAHRAQKHRATELAKTSKLSLDNLFEQMQAGNVKDLNLIVKADVQGSIEALRESLEKLTSGEVRINVIHSGVGTVLESDVSLAEVSNAIIVAFNVRPNAKVTDMAAEENVDIRYYDVIYNAINEIKDAIVGMMESTYKEHITGRAEVRDTFTIPKIGTIAGSYVTDGKIERGSKVRLLRDGVVIFDGKLGSLRRFKDDVKEVATGYECGIGIENYNDIKVSDILEFYYLEEIKPVLA